MERELQFQISTGKIPPFCSMIRFKTRIPQIIAKLYINGSLKSTMPVVFSSIDFIENKAGFTSSEN